MFDPEKSLSVPAQESAQTEAEKNETEISAEQIVNVQSALLDFLELKPKDRVVLLQDADSNKQTIQVLKSALEKIGSSCAQFTITDETKKAQLEELVKDAEVVISLSMHDTSEDVYDDGWLENYKYRLWALLDADPGIFKNGGAITEKKEDLENRLNKMESVLEKARGFKIKSLYGTDLELSLRKFGERRWHKNMGVIGPGKWDNLPNGEIFTTPDERTVNGVLVLPVLDSEISAAQGVDEFVHVNIKDGVITSIEGGKSAQKMREQLEKDMRDEKKLGENPYDVLRIAEISFGANTKARSRAFDPEKSYKLPGASMVEAEKRFGTMHLAFGDSKHGEEGAGGFESVKIGSHYDFVIPRNGLTVEMFMNEKDFDQKRNGRKIIEEGSIRFFD